MPRVLPIVQLGDPVLRRSARALAREELADPKMKELIDAMRETMRRAPGVGLAAPQIGLGLRLAVIEDLPDPERGLSAEERAARERDSVPFHVIVNPTLVKDDPTPVRHFEGCLSMTGFVAMVDRAHGVKVECLDEKGEPRTITARGWYARILQHEIDHLNGVVYVDRALTRTLMHSDEMARHWGDSDLDEVVAALEADRAP